MIQVKWSYWTFICWFSTGVPPRFSTGYLDFFFVAPQIIYQVADIGGSVWEITLTLRSLNYRPGSCASNVTQQCLYLVEHWGTAA